MLPANLLGIFLALISGIVWGSGDFVGGYSTRNRSQYHVLALSAFSGLAVLIAAALISRETFPAWQGMFFSALAGLSGALAVAVFYRALSQGPNTVIAPTAGVISAMLPVIFGAVTLGLPAITRLAGFGLAFAGIWLVSAGPNGGKGISPQAFRMASLAGLGFGGFFIFIGQVEPGKIFTPLILARGMTFITGLILIWIHRQRLPSLASNPLALLAGVLDSGGNLFYILARQYTRLDVAAVLASLYPMSTVILAGAILKEKVTRRQWLGVLTCLAAIALITV
jgi:drug/metabolite transporter (DMT)-like permease